MSHLMGRGGRSQSFHRGGREQSVRSGGVCPAGRTITQRLRMKKKSRRENTAELRKNHKKGERRNNGNSASYKQSKKLPGPNDQA